MTLPVTQLPGARLVARGLAEVARRTPLDLGRDADELLRVFDGLPTGSARKSFTRTLRSVVDWRGQLVTMLDRCYLAEDLPTLLVWGDRDGVIPVTHGRLAHEAMPGSRLEVFAGAGHFPHHAEPERFVDLLTAFVDQSEPARFEPDRWVHRLRTGRPAVAAAADPPEPVDEVQLTV